MGVGTNGETGTDVTVTGITLYTAVTPEPLASKPTVVAPVVHTPPDAVDCDVTPKVAVVVLVSEYGNTGVFEKTRPALACKLNVALAVAPTVTVCADAATYFEIPS